MKIDFVKLERFTIVLLWTWQGVHNYIFTTKMSEQTQLSTMLQNRTLLSVEKTTDYNFQTKSRHLKFCYLKSSIRNLAHSDTNLQNMYIPVSEIKNVIWNESFIPIQLKFWLRYSCRLQSSISILAISAKNPSCEIFYELLHFAALRPCGPLDKSGKA